MRVAVYGQASALLNALAEFLDDLVMGRDGNDFLQDVGKNSRN
jgi:hypothetical protein